MEAFTGGTPPFLILSLPLEAEILGDQEGLYFRLDVTLWVYLRPYGNTHGTWYRAVYIPSIFNELGIFREPPKAVEKYQLTI